MSNVRKDRRESDNDLLVRARRALRTHTEEVEPTETAVEAALAGDDS